MVIGVGVDIILLSRISKSIETSGKVFLDKVFTPSEQQRAEIHPNPVAYMAMTFAAKEAIFKTFGIGWNSGVKFTEIDVRDGKYGEPIPILSGRFAEIAAEKHASQVHLSLSYDGEYAIGVATLSKE